MTQLQEGSAGQRFPTGTEVFFKKTNKKTDETSLLTKIDEGFWHFWLHFSDLDAMFIFYTDGLCSDCKTKPSYIEV